MIVTVRTPAGHVYSMSGAFYLAKRIPFQLVEIDLREAS